MSLSVIVLLSNLVFWLIWTGFEIRRRRAGALPEVPFALILIAISVNALLFDSLLLFRFGAFVALTVSIWEAREFVRLGVPELSLAAVVVSGGFGAVVLTWFAVLFINEHLNLTMG